VNDPRGRSLELLIGLGVAALLVAASVLTLGMPNLGLAGQLLGGAYPTMASAVAVSSLICYAVVLLAALAVLAGALRRGAGGWVGGRGLRAVALILAGATLLSLSLVNRVDTGTGICCGGGSQQTQEAAALAR